jgi:hypothetical protein
MIAKTQAELRALVRFYTDTESELAKFPDAAIDIQLDFGLQCYHAALVRTMNWVQVKEYEFTTTTASSYSMPLHYKTVGVDMKVGSDRWVPLRRANMFSAPHLPSDKRGRAQYSEYLLDESQYVVLHRRTQVAGQVYRLRYIAPSRTITGEPTPDFDYLFPNGWEEVPVLEAAIRLLAKQKEDDGQLRALLAAAYARMDAEASTADIYQRPTAPGVFNLEIGDEGEV